MQRFGAALNAHLHYHCCLIDGVFSSDGNDLRFHPAVALTKADVVAVQELVRNRVLSLFVRRGLLSSEAAADMRQWDHGSAFSLDATIRIRAHDRAGLERLLRYCARPAFARDRLEWADDEQEHLLYHMPRPWPDGQTVIRLDPLELLDRLAAVIPPPRSHRHCYHGVLAPNARLRSAATARAGLPVEPADTEHGTAESSEPDSAIAAPEVTVHSRCSSLWATMLARIYKVFPLVYPNCGSEMRVISFITRVDSIERILSHIGEPTTVPPAHRLSGSSLSIRPPLTASTPPTLCPSSSSTSGSVGDRADPLGVIAARVRAQHGPKERSPAPRAASTTPRSASDASSRRHLP